VSREVRNGSVALVRDLNRSAVLRMVGQRGPIARAEIARALGLSPATVTAVTRELISSGLVRVVDQAPSRGGRPSLLLGLVGAAAHAVGVKVAADHLVGVRVDLDGDVLAQFECPFDAAAPEPVGRLAELLAPHVETASAGAPLFLGVGLGVPGVVDGAGHSVVESPVLGWSSLPVGRLLQETLGVPVLVENDVNTLAVAERLYGRGRGCDHFITVTSGRGVGLGIIVGGDVYRGARGGAGEFGHVSVVADGPLCACGNRGCLEALVADPALVARAQEAGLLKKRAGIDELRALADDGDSRATRVFAEAGETLGRAVAGLVNVLSPELIVVSGEGTQAWEHMAGGFGRGLDEAVFRPLRDIPVVIDPWDDAKWALGAAALVLRATFVAALDEEPADRSVRALLRDGSTVDAAVAV
jgi:predicted NBD/HSP70 family sugar kinase